MHSAGEPAAAGTACARRRRGADFPRAARRGNRALRGTLGPRDAGAAGVRPGDDHLRRGPDPVGGAGAVLGTVRRRPCASRAGAAARRADHHRARDTAEHDSSCAARNRGRDRGKPADRRGADDGKLPDPTGRTERAPQPGRGDREERADDGRVELRAAAAQHLAKGSRPGERPFVGPSRGHDLERVGEPDDPRPEADLRAAQPARIAAAVEMLVVLQDDVAVPVEPTGERRREPGADRRMEPQRLPFPFGRLSRLAQQLRRHLELADVVDQRRPAQPVAGGGGQLHLGGDHVGEDPHPLAVPPGHPIVTGQRRHEREDRGRRCDRFCVGDARRQQLQMPQRAGLAGDPPTRGRLAGKQDRELEQRGQRQQPPKLPAGRPGDQAADEHDRGEPSDAGSHRLRRGNQPGDDEGERDAHRHRREQDHAPQQQRDSAARSPARQFVIHQRCVDLRDSRG